MRKVRRSAEQWRELFTRQAGSGKSVEAFCEAEGVNTSLFYRWRRQLQGRSSPPARNKPSPAAGPFIDLGAVKGTGAEGRCEVRVDFGGGVIFSLVRG
jgi:transposase-like protein